MKLYKTDTGALLVHAKGTGRYTGDWDTLVNRDDLYAYLVQLADELPGDNSEPSSGLPPIGNQEVWAAGVTYLKSRDARMEESKDSGGASMYDKVYDAERPELFFKSLAHRVSGDRGTVYIRKDSIWNVPEPELTLFMSSSGSIQGYTIGNDMSSRSIEGENPLYLPQAKIYERSAALGPCLFVPGQPLPGETLISMAIERGGQEVYHDSVQINRMKRGLPELAEFLFRECNFPFGCYLMTGTCLVPDSSFTLAPGDVVRISISGIGAMTNIVALKK